MKTLTINLTEKAYHAIREALQEQTGEEHTVTEWLESELNDNTDVIIEMLLEDF